MRDRVSPRRSFRITGAAVATCTFGVPALAEITVPPAFSVDVLLDQIDGRTPHLTAISNPDYGFGVIATAIDEGILTVLRISQNTVELLGETLLNDAYTITIADTVVSVADGTGIDGDLDGSSGGDAVITMEHRCGTDTNDDGEIGFDELLEVAVDVGSVPVTGP